MLSKKERNLLVRGLIIGSVKMSTNDPVYGKHRYENKCKVTFEFECIGTADITKCRFWSGTVVLASWLYHLTSARI